MGKGPQGPKRRPASSFSRKKKGEEGIVKSLSKTPTMIANATIRAAARAGSRRPMSAVAAPKMHKAKDAWAELQKTRPPPGHPHVSEIDTRPLMGLAGG